MPTILYRHLKDIKAVGEHTRGNLWLHSSSHFRKIEDNIRRDASEGCASGQIHNSLYLSFVNDSFPTQATYILSFSECPKLPDLGTHVVELIKPKAFECMVKAALPKDSMVSFWQVVYSDEVNYRCYPTIPKINQRAMVTKPVRFQGEQEWRLVVRLPGRFKIRTVALSWK